MTEISPRHWPADLKDEFSVCSDPDSDNGSGAEESAHSPSEFMLDGTTVTKEGIAERCMESFSGFLAILKKLKDQNAHFYETDLLDATLRHHIAEAGSTEDLISIREYVESQGRWQDPSAFECLADRFMELGEKDNAVDCFASAYLCYNTRNALGYLWQGNPKYLATIEKVNKTTATMTLLEKCYNSVSRTEGGYDTAPIAATGLDILNDPCLLETVFEDFLTHCESMFAQLPKDNDYAWLKEYAGPTFDENRLILQFCIEDLDTPEINHGERLIQALTRLAIARPQSTIPLLVSETLSANGRRLRRLLMILHTLANQKPNPLASNQQMLAKLLDREDFYCRHSAKCILRCVSKVSPLETAVSAAVERIDRNYSAAISHSTYRLPSKPSSAFSNFLKKNTLIHFSEQVKTIEKILQIQPGSLVAAIEECFNAQNWSMDEERSRIKDDWYGHVHTQGWPVVWITTEFQERVTEILWDILNEVAEKQRLSQAQIQWLWQATQMVDPEYVVREPMIRPSDIRMLRVAEKEAWFRELDEIESFQVGNASTDQQNTDWLTVFEKQMLAYEEKYNVPYRQKTSLISMLIPLQVYGGSDELDELNLPTERIAQASAMAVTFEQVRDVLKNRGGDGLNVNEDCIPLIAEHQNPRTFLGFWYICSLASFILDEFDLSFDGFDLTRDDEVVAKYEAWQEGYQAEAYSRERLSYGVRLRVRRDLIAEICLRYQRLLCTRIDEKREFYESKYDREPETRKESKRYVIYH